MPDDDGDTVTEPATEIPSQDDLDKQFAARAKKAERSATKAAEAAAAETLGMSVEEAAKFIADRRAADEAAKDETTRALEEASRAKSEAAAERDQLARERRAARIERALIRAGVDSDDTISLLTAAPQFAEITSDSDDEDVTAAVDAAREAFPGLFTTSTATNGSDARRSSAPHRRVPDTKPSAGGPLEQGAEMARKRRELRSVPATPQTP